MARVIREFLRGNPAWGGQSGALHVEVAERLAARADRGTGGRFMCSLDPAFHAALPDLGRRQELTTAEGYGSFARRTFESAAQTCLIASSRERRHFSFYYNKARAAWKASRAQRLTTFLLRQFWTPVGQRREGRSRRQLVNPIRFGDSPGEFTRRIDSTIGRLPGRAGSTWPPPHVLIDGRRRLEYHLIGR